MPAVISSLFDGGVKSVCLVGRALHHHQKTPSQLFLQKFICPLKLLGLSCFRLYLLVSECLSNTKMNFSAAFVPLSSLSLPVKIQGPLKPEKKKWDNVSERTARRLEPLREEKKGKKKEDKT